MSGAVVDGPVSGATVNAYEVTAAGTAGTLVGNPILLQATGATYVDDVTGQSVDLAKAGLTLSALISPPTANGIPIPVARNAGGTVDLQYLLTTNGALTETFYTLYSSSVSNVQVACTPLSVSVTEFVLHSLKDTSVDSGVHYGNLIQGIDGAFYGTTFEGGAYGFGTVFRIN